MFLKSVTKIDFFTPSRKCNKCYTFFSFFKASLKSLFLYTSVFYFYQIKFLSVLRKNAFINNSHTTKSVILSKIFTPGKAKLIPGQDDETGGRDAGTAGGEGEDPGPRQGGDRQAGGGAPAGDRGDDYGSSRAGEGAQHAKTQARGMIFCYKGSLKKNV